MDSTSTTAAAAGGMGFLPALGIGAGVGLLKSWLFDMPREARERKVAAAQMRYSPWTKIPAQQIHTANPLGDALQYGLTGAGLFQSGENEASDRAFKAAMMENMKNNANSTSGPAPAGANPWSLGMPNLMNSMTIKPY